MDRVIIRFFKRSRQREEQLTFAALPAEMSLRAAEYFPACSLDYDSHSVRRKVCPKPQPSTIIEVTAALWEEEGEEGTDRLITRKTMDKEVRWE